MSCFLFYVSANLTYNISNNKAIVIIGSDKKSPITNRIDFKLSSFSILIDINSLSKYPSFCFKNKSISSLFSD